MANESEVVRGTYAQLIASHAESDGGFCPISGALDGSLTDGSEDYPLLDFKLNVTGGTVTENASVDLYRVPSDGTDDAPTPGGAYLQHYVGSFVVDTNADELYLYGVANVDSKDKIYLAEQRIVERYGHTVRPWSRDRTGRINATHRAFP
jgi:hypothetical protein